MFKIFRIALLLSILIIVWTSYTIQRNVHHGWNGTLDIRIIPVIADNEPATETFVRTLSEDSFSRIAPYLIKQGARYGRDLDYAFDFAVEPPISNVPPLPPGQDRSVIAAIWWSLKLRWWSWRNELSDHSGSQIRLYVLYQSIDKNTLLPHSTGLQNGLIGLIHARADTSYRRSQQLVIVHELLHILGATDKYDLNTGQPIYPQGYANPELSPRYPQRAAEIMGRSIPLSQSRHDVAKRLTKTLVGELTAKEIGWTE